MCTDCTPAEDTPDYAGALRSLEELYTSAFYFVQIQYCVKVERGDSVSTTFCSAQVPLDGYLFIRTDFRDDRGTAKRLHLSMEFVSMSERTQTVCSKWTVGGRPRPVPETGLCRRELYHRQYTDGDSTEREEFFRAVLEVVGLLGRIGRHVDIRVRPGYRQPPRFIEDVQRNLPRALVPFGIVSVHIEEASDPPECGLPSRLREMPGTAVIRATDAIILLADGIDWGVVFDYKREWAKALGMDALGVVQLVERFGDVPFKITLHNDGLEVVPDVSPAVAGLRPMVLRGACNLRQLCVNWAMRTDANGPYHAMEDICVETSEGSEAWWEAWFSHLSAQHNAFSTPLAGL